MKAVILAAGTASRLRPLTNNTPKCLLKIGERSLLERTIDALLENQVDQLVIVTGYLHEMIETLIASRYPSVQTEFIYNEQYETTNNIYSLWMTRESVLNQEILLLDSDILFDARIITSLLRSPHPNCLALNRHPLGEEEIKVVVDTNNKIKEISKVCAIDQAEGESIGIERMSPAFVNTLFAELDIMIQEKKQTGIFYEAAFENIIRKGAEIYAVDTTTYFSMELDTIQDFETACEKIPVNLH